MAETATQEKLNTDIGLEEFRLLTDVAHLRLAMAPDGSIPSEVEADIKINLQTAVYEKAIPLGVAITHQKIEELESEAGETKRVITWLGQTAVESAMKGKLYHRHESAHKRVDVEVAEARHAQEKLHAGIAQVFISPKMSEQDAPKHIARQEHLYDEDSLRVSYIVNDSRGKPITRRIESLLLRDVQLSDWVKMLKDTANIFGKSFILNNENSALSVMELFDQFDIAEADIPNGPIDLVSAVLPYIKDVKQKLSVQEQLEGFKKDQLKYKIQAEKTAAEWYGFEVELAKSLESGQATYEIRRFIAIFQDMWEDESLSIIRAHAKDNFEFRMTNKLAAVLERAKQNILTGTAGLATDNKSILAQIKPEMAEEIQADIRQINQLRFLHAPQSEIMSLQAQMDRKVASQNIKGGGGCSGTNRDSFSILTNGVSRNLNRNNDSESDLEDDDADDKENWKWAYGKCIIKVCPSPKPTKVGPCQICARCQDKFDKGEDPTKLVEPVVVKDVGKVSVGEALVVKDDTPLDNSDKVDNVVALKFKKDQPDQFINQTHPLEMAA